MPDAEDQTRKPQEDKHWLEYAIFVFVVLTAAGTIGAAYYARNQWLTADDTEKRENRAYVYLEIQVISYPPGDAPNRYAISLKVTNSGKTWARKLFIDKQVVSPSTAEPFDALTKVRHPVSEPMVLGPGQNITLQFGEVPFTDLLDISLGRKTFDYVALVTYEDVINSPPIKWQTQLSQRLNADIEGKGHISFAYRTTHNCADYDCPEK
ncbi:MAG: hypothetical protein ACLPKB_05900 [Xanthobacteraceae bacterium]